MAERATGGPQITEELAALALTGACGALEIDGDVSGSIYLHDGRITFAQTSAVPGLADRLIGSRRLTRAQWSALAAESQAADDLAADDRGALLIERGLMGRDDLESVLRSAVMDAITALTVPPEGAPAGGNRFLPGARHWAGHLLSIDVESACAQAGRRAGRLARLGVSPRSRPAPPDRRRRRPTIGRELRMLAAKIDGVATVRDLARQNGLALYDTIEWVGELADRGACTLLPPEEPAPPRTEAATGLLAAPVAEPPGPGGALPPLPRRAGGQGVTAGPDGTQAGPGGAPHPEVLRQLLDGLRQLR